MDLTPISARCWHRDDLKTTDGKLETLKIDNHVLNVWTRERLGLLEETKQVWLYFAGSIFDTTHIH